MFTIEQREQLKSLAQKLQAAVEGSPDGSLRKIAGQISNVVATERRAVKATQATQR